MSKELLTIEFRWDDKVTEETQYRTKVITIGVYDSLDEAVKEGNEALSKLSKVFQVRSDDKFKVRGLWGLPHRLVTNTCYPTKRIQYFAKITRLDFESLDEKINYFSDLIKNG